MGCEQHSTLQYMTYLESGLRETVECCNAGLERKPTIRVSAVMTCLITWRLVFTDHCRSTSFGHGQLC